MSAICRLASRGLLDQALRSQKCGMLSLVRPITLKPQSAPTHLNLGHDERNMKLGRPQSPHLTVYAPQLTSMLSISHRGTGIALTGYMVAFSAFAVCSPETMTYYLDYLEQAQLGSVVVGLGKFALAFPLTYHFWNGIRHLIWDTGKFLSLKDVYTTGYIMLLAAIGSAVALSVL